MKHLKVATIFLLVAVFFILSGCSVDSGENIIFGTFYNIELKGTSARRVLRDIDNLLVEIENQTSTVIEDSDVYKINNAPKDQPIKIRNHTYELFKASQDLYEITEGAFNPAVYPLVELWQFSPDKFRLDLDEIPIHSQIISTAEYSKFELFELDEENMTLTKSHDQAKLDFGGIAKGYAVDLTKELVENLSQGLINIGGAIYAHSRNANIAITHPRASGYFGVIKLENKSVSTSGDYERSFVVDDTIYAHIMDKDGYPASVNRFYIISASIIGDSAMYCDALATAVIVNGLQWAYDNISELGYSALLISHNPFSQVDSGKYFNIIGDIDFQSRQSEYEQKTTP